MPNGDEFSVKIEHDMGFFLDPNVYAPILKINDDAAVVVKLSLIHENFLTVFIENMRKDGTEKYVKSDKYFHPKLCTCVALGLPTSIANCLSYLNAIRNKYAHEISYQLSDEDVQKFDVLLKTITMDDINHFGFCKPNFIEPLLNQGADAIKFMTDLPYSTPLSQRRRSKLVAQAFVLSNFCSFYFLNAKQESGSLKLSYGH